MDKVDFSDNTLKKSLVKYFIFFTLLGFMLSCITFFSTNRIAENIRSSYPVIGEQYYLTNEKGELLGDGVIIGEEQMPLSKADEMIISILDVLPMIMSPTWFLICIVTAVFLFYKNKLKIPFTELTKASENIAKNNLDFTVGYKSKDELGQLCSSFEIMRSTLAQNFSELYRQAEERKCINAAFAHDLRTPLTVLKGQSDMLIKYSSEMSAEKVSDTASMMKRHIERLSTYVDTMNSLQRLEDIEIKKNPVLLSVIAKQLKLTGESVCNNNNTTFQINAFADAELNVDFAVIAEVCENLLSNASRYAKSVITITLKVQSGMFIAEIEDDGNGFSDEEIKNATNPFYKSDKNSGAEHFGMGLHICKILCEKHGGYLKLQNVGGAKITAAFKM